MRDSYVKEQRRKKGKKHNENLGGIILEYFRLVTHRITLGAKSGDKLFRNIARENQWRGEFFPSK